MITVAGGTASGDKQFTVTCPKAGDAKPGGGTYATDYFALSGGYNIQGSIKASYRSSSTGDPTGSIFVDGHPDVGIDPLGHGVRLTAHRCRNDITHGFERRGRLRAAASVSVLKHHAPSADLVCVDAPSCTKAADLVGLRERLDDLDRRRVAALTRPTALSSAERHQLELMRFELAEVDWHLMRLESN